MSLFIVAVDNTIVNVALPSIQRDLNAPVSGLQWIIDAYTLVLASLLMLAGSTADRVGRRRTFQLGLVLFTLASALCSLAPSLGWLVAFRALQAVGGSMLNPVAMSIISNTFTDAKERTRVGTASTIGVYAGAAGPSPFREDVPLPMAAFHPIPAFKKINELMIDFFADATGLEVVNYRIAGAWGGHEGSLLLWTLMLGVWMVAVSLFSGQQ